MQQNPWQRLFKRTPYLPKTHLKRSLPYNSLLLKANFSGHSCQKEPSSKKLPKLTVRSSKAWDLSSQPKLKQVRSLSGKEAVLAPSALKSERANRGKSRRLAQSRPLQTASYSIMTNIFQAKLIQQRSCCLNWWTNSWNGRTLMKRSKKSSCRNSLSSEIRQKIRSTRPTKASKKTFWWSWKASKSTTPLA